jgi:hypothetical protein
MSYVTVVPDMLAAAATDVAGVGSMVNAAHAAAAAPTVAVIPAAADQVSTAISQLFSQFGANYHAKAGQATAFLNEFVQNLAASGGSFAGAELANVASLVGKTVTTAITELSPVFVNVATGVLNSLEGVIKGFLSTIELLGVTAINLVNFFLAANYLLFAFAVLYLQFILFFQFHITIPVPTFIPVPQFQP